MQIIKPCPCGEIPKKLSIESTPWDWWKLVDGQCCGVWKIGVTVEPDATDSEIYETCLESWNSAPVKGS